MMAYHRPGNIRELEPPIFETQKTRDQEELGIDLETK